jgi:flagellar biogenesis protein FliO
MRKLAGLFLLSLSPLLCFVASAQDEKFERAAPPEISSVTEVITPESPVNDDEGEAQEADEVIDEIGKAWDENTSASTDDDGTAASPPAGSDSADAEGLDGDLPPGSFAILRSVAALCATLALFLLLLYAFKRWGRRTPLLAGHSLGTVLGRISLSPQASVHFVRIQNEVLVIGVTQHSVNLLRTMDTELFEPEETDLPTVDAGGAEPADFLSQLRLSQASMEESASGVDEELDNLKGDLQRLKQYFQESTRDSD